MNSLKKEQIVSVVTVQMQFKNTATFWENFGSQYNVNLFFYVNFR